jgi:hypothetical protein
MWDAEIPHDADLEGWATEQAQAHGIANRVEILFLGERSIESADRELVKVLIEVNDCELPEEVRRFIVAHELAEARFKLDGTQFADPLSKEHAADEFAAKLTGIGPAIAALAETWERAGHSGAGREHPSFPARIQHLSRSLSG